MSELNNNTPGHLVLDLGNSHLVGGLFVQDKLLSTFRIDVQKTWKRDFKKQVELLLHSDFNIKKVLLGSVNSALTTSVIQELEVLDLSVQLLQNSLLKKLHLAVTEPETVGADLIANAYGALKLYPGNSIVIDIGTAVTISVINRENTFLGGIIYPGIKMSANALADYTDGLPYIKIAKPANRLGKDTETHIQNGVFYGLIATLHYFIQQYKKDIFKTEKSTVILTGGITDLHAGEDPSERRLSSALREELRDSVDIFEPDLTLIGLNEILKESALELHKETGEKSYTL